jgi:hypothetical protein
MRPQHWILNLQGHDGCADLSWQVAALFPRGSEEAPHPFSLEASYLAVQGALRGTSLSGSFSWRETEEDNRTQQFVAELFRKLGQQLELLPVVGWLNRTSLVGCHRTLPVTTKP